jgi:hypothetical protein
LAEDVNSIKIKKRHPYPFDVSVEKNGLKAMASVLKVVLHGLLIDVKLIGLVVGEKVTLDIILPAACGAFRVDCKVIKTYDRVIVESGQSRTQRIAELHFVRHPLPEQERGMVNNFLQAIQQSGSQK